MCLICEYSDEWFSPEHLILILTTARQEHPESFKISQMGPYERKCFSHEEECPIPPKKK